MTHKITSLLIFLLFAMLLYVPLGGWRLFSSEVPDTDRAPRQYGASYPVPGFQWVTVMNDRGVVTDQLHLPKYSQCLMRYRGRVREITNYRSLYKWWSGSLLMEYQPPPESAATGVLCPGGTVYFTAQAVLDTFAARFEERSAWEAGLKTEMMAFTARRWPEGGTPVRDYFTWVEVVNPRGVLNFGYTVPFLDTCGIESGGATARVGDTSQGAVFAYRAPAGRGFLGVGIPCPDGTLFLPEGPRVRYF